MIVPCLAGGNASATCLKILIMQYKVVVHYHYYLQYCTYGEEVAEGDSQADGEGVGARRIGPVGVTGGKDGQD